jgi:hypothetical protein
MGAGRCQPLAKGKGVHREVESEGSRRQSSAPRNTNIIRHKRGTSLLFKAKSNKRHGHGTVNDVGTWNESDSSYRGRSHGRVELKSRNAVETRFTVRSQQKP